MDDALHRLALAVLAAWTTSVVAACGPEVGPAGGDPTAVVPGETDPSLDQRLDALLPPLMAEYHVPGVALAVLADGDLALVRHEGVRRAGGDVPVDEETTFQAASLSKPVFAYGVHVLAKEGRIDLDRPLTAYTERPYVDDPRLEAITARVVLSHTTGFPNWRPGRWGDDPGPLVIEHDPGTAFGYSGEGYVYLQRVVETITGETLDVFLRRAVLDPLGMDGSSFVWEKRYDHLHAAPHDGDGEPQTKWRPDEALAAGTLQTTAADYARFLCALLVGWSGEDDARYPLDAGEVEAMLAPVSTINGRLGWSSGWGVETTGAGIVFWQWGDDGPFKAFAAGSRASGRAVVVLTNGQWGLDVARPVVEEVVGERAFLDFRNVNYR